MKHLRLARHHGLAVLMLSFAACIDAGPDSSQQLAQAGALSPGDDAGSAISCDTGCDDSDPCTDDSCVDGGCIHDLVAGCTIYDCNSLGLLDLEALKALEGDALWKAAASPEAAHQTQSCAALPCEGRDTCCESCTTDLNLAFEDGLLEPVSTDQDAPWQCTIDPCTETERCDPLSLEAGYWLWGRTATRDEGLEYVVQGWCLQTTSQTLPGEYIGSWVSGSAEAHTVQVTIAHTGTWSISIVGLRECVDCDFSVPQQQATGIAIRDGSLEFQIAVCEGGEACVAGQVPVKVSLRSHRDQLIGTFEETQNFGAGFGLPYSGAVGLERLSP